MQLERTAEVAFGKAEFSGIEVILARSLPLKLLLKRLRPVLRQHADAAVLELASPVRWPGIGVVTESI